MRSPYGRLMMLRVVQACAHVLIDVADGFWFSSGDSAVIGVPLFDVSRSSVVTRKAKN